MRTVSATAMFAEGQGDVNELLGRARAFRKSGDRAAALAAFKAAAELDQSASAIKVEMVTDLRALDRLEEANRLLREVLASEPANLAALIEDGHLKRRHGDHAGALAAFQSASAASPRHIGIRIEMARDLRALNRLDEADQALSSVLGSEPHNLGALIEQGHVRRRRGDHAGALAAFEAAASGEPKHLGIKLEIARDLRALGRLAEAEAILQTVLDVAPANLVALIDIALIRRQRGDLSGSLTALETAAAVDPRHAGVKFELATGLRAVGRLAEAESALRAVLEINPASSNSAISLGYLLMEGERFDEARAVFEKGQAANPNDFRFAKGLAQATRGSGNREAALGHLRSAVRLAPDNLEVRLGLAYELREQGHYDEALPLLRSILEQKPNDWSATMQLGYLHRGRNEHDHAIAAFLSAVAAQPKKTQALIELARENWMIGRPQEAHALMESGIEQNPSDVGLLFVAAEFALMGEDPLKALELVGRAVAVQPRQLNLYLLAARAAAFAADRELAEAWLERADAAIGPHPDALATRIQILKHFSDYKNAQELTVASDSAAGHFGAWMERTSLAIALGDFDRADQALAAAPAGTQREAARVHFLRGHLHEARRDYPQAIASFGDALAIDASEPGWHDDMARVCILTLDLDTAAVHLRKSIALNASVTISRGQPRNMSQHYLGQLLDEFALDRALLAELKGILASPAKSRLESLKRVTRKHPDSTAAALMLLVAMRQSGALAPTGKSRFPIFGKARIPKRIVQFWDAENPPDDIVALMDSWRGASSDYAHVLFNDESSAAYLRIKASADVVRAFHRATHPAQRADLFRLAYLAREGGVYADADDRRRAPLDELVPSSASFVAYQENYGTIANNFLAVVPKHPVIVRALDLAVTAINRGDSDGVWLSTGPALLTRAFAGIVSEPGSALWLKRVLVRELAEMRTVVDIHCPARYKSTERHWSRAAFRRVATAAAAG